MRTPPACRALGSQCRTIAVTLRIAQLDEDDATFHDAAGTWLLGHTERIDFGPPYVAGNRLLVDAVVSVPCRYLRPDGQGGEAGGGGRQDAAGQQAAVRCGAHGFRGLLPVAPPRPARPALRRPDGTFTVVQGQQVTTLPLPPMEPASRALPVLDQGNPCHGAPCRTADNRLGAACCRDLTLEVVAPDADGAIEALLRSRRAPYLCKIDRTGPDLIDCEVISACGYLDADGVDCTLHGRTRPDGAPAKPSICSQWPDLEPGSPGHPGCCLIDLAIAPGG